jgi:hypothetical protein
MTPAANPLAKWTWRKSTTAKVWFARVGNLQVSVQGHDPAAGLPPAGTAMTAFRPPMLRIQDVLVTLGRAEKGAGFTVACLPRLNSFGWFRPHREFPYESYTDAVRAFYAVTEQLGRHRILQRLRSYREDLIGEAWTFYKIRTMLGVNVGTAPWRTEYDSDLILANSK